MGNIPGPPCKSFVYGNLEDLLGLDSWPFHDYLEENFPGIARLRGPFGSDVLYVSQPGALHHILVKDQYIYETARFFLRTHELVLGKGLFATLGEHHRKQRKLLNPVFSSKHLRNMVPTFYDIGRLAMESQLQAGAAELDVAEWSGRAALEIMGQAGLGYSFDPLVDERPNQYTDAFKMVTYAIGRAAIPRRLLPYLPNIRFGGIGHALLTLVPHDGVRQLLDISDTLWGCSTTVYNEKKQALQKGDAVVAQQVGEGKDIMSILLRANMEASEDDKLEEEELIGQMSTLLLAAVDSTSNTLSMILELLAKHPEAQEKLRAEILQAGADQDLDFDTLMGLPYLEAVCRETLRVYAPLNQVFREARKDVVLPLAEPIRGLDGQMIHEIFVPKNTTVVAGLHNCNRNKALWGPDAYEWKPERWLSPLPTAVTEAKIPGIYANLMSFLGGGRACIGYKFAQIEMKVLLSLLLSRFTFESSDEPIVWKMGGVRYPSVARSGDHKASLPMKVRLYRIVE
ncbi:cytochrome P450 [Cubamyces sp. BRFM 1775]|nr:cytochrome P450 [Cubamyces sp. BRFM 1775]